MSMLRNIRWAMVLVAGFYLIGCSNDRSSDGATDGQPKKPKIAYVTNGVAPFWTIAEAGAKEGGKEFDADVEVLMPVEGIGHQKQMIEDLLTRGIDGIAVSPIDPANQIDLLDKAAAMVPLLTHDSDAPDSKRLVYIGMDNYDAGRMAGKLVKEAIPEGGKVVILVGRLEQDNAKRRRQGVIDELLDRDSDSSRFDPPGNVLGEGGKYQVLETLTDQFDRAKAKANAEDAISKYQDLACMVGLFEYNPPLIIEALRLAGKGGKIKVVGFDENATTLQAIIDGECQGTIAQDPFMYGKKSVEVLSALHRGNTDLIPENKFIDIPAQRIVKDNVEEFWTTLKTRLGEI